MLTCLVGVEICNLEEHLQEHIKYVLHLSDIKDGFASLPMSMSKYSYNRDNHKEVLQKAWRMLNLTNSKSKLANYGMNQ